MKQMLEIARVFDEEVSLLRDDYYISSIELDFEGIEKTFRAFVSKNGDMYRTEVSIKYGESTRISVQTAVDLLMHDLEMQDSGLYLSNEESIDMLAEEVDKMKKLLKNLTS